MLSPAEQVLFRRLAVFAGGFSLEAVTTICPLKREIWDEWEVLSNLEDLVSKSLLLQSQRDGIQRFTMLETIREYANEQLALSDEEQPLRWCHAQCVLKLAAMADEALDGPEQQTWTTQLEAELENIRAALDWSLRHPHGERNIGLQLVGVLARFWGRQRYHREGRNWLMLALDATRNDAGQQIITARAQALYGVGYLAMQQGDIEAARAFHEQGLALRRQIDSPADIATSLFGLGLANVYWGDYAAAQVQLEESLAIFTTMEDTCGIALARRGLGSVALRSGDYAAARQHYQASFSLARAHGNTLGIAIALNYLGITLVQQGDYAEAQRLLREALTLFQEIGHPLGMIEALQGLACVAGACGQVEQATRLFGATEVFRTRLGFFLPPADHPLVVPYIVKTRAQMDTASFTATWVAGQDLAMDQAIALALAAEPSPSAVRSTTARAPEYHVSSTPSPAVRIPQRTVPVEVSPVPVPAATHADLMAREVDVLQLLATGLTNNAIAKHLSLSTYTVNAHLRSIYGKLGVTSRSAATRYALEHRLVEKQ